LRRRWNDIKNDVQNAVPSCTFAVPAATAAIYLASPRLRLIPENSCTEVIPVRPAGCERHSKTGFAGRLHPNSNCGQHLKRVPSCLEVRNALSLAARLGRTVRT
jgi:hypothetical protein